MVYVLVTAPDRARPPCRVQIHFSEPVDDFTVDDLVARNCRVARLVRARADLFVAHVAVDPYASNEKPMSVQVAAGAATSTAARRSQRRVVSAQSPAFHFAPLALAASQE